MERPQYGFFSAPKFEDATSLDEVRKKLVQCYVSMAHKVDTIEECKYLLGEAREVLRQPSQADELLNALIQAISDSKQ